MMAPAARSVARVDRGILPGLHEPAKVLAVEQELPELGPVRERDPHASECPGPLEIAHRPGAHAEVAGHRRKVEEPGRNRAQPFRNFLNCRGRKRGPGVCRASVRLGRLRGPCARNVAVRRRRPPVRRCSGPPRPSGARPVAPGRPRRPICSGSASGYCGPLVPGVVAQASLGFLDTALQIPLGSELAQVESRLAQYAPDLSGHAAHNDRRP